MLEKHKGFIMPRKKITFEEHKETVFKDFNVLEPAEVKLGTYNSCTKVTFVCNQGHTYRLSASEIQRNKNPKDPNLCPHCKILPNSKQGHKSQGIHREFVEKYANKYNIDFEPKQEYYSRWTDSITFKCIKDGFEKTVKSLNHWEKTLPTFICDQCEIDKLGLISKVDLENKLKELKHNNIIETTKINELAIQTNKDMLSYPPMIRKHLHKWEVVKYVNTRTKGVFRCKSCGNEKVCLPTNLEAGKNGCNECAKIRTRNQVIEQLLDKCSKYNVYPLKEQPYKSIDIPILFKCNDCGKEFQKEWTDINRHHPINCPECYKSTKRKTQTEVYDWINSIYKGEVIFEDKSNGFELDIYLPERKIGIEYCGLIWHSTKYRPETTYHRNKWKLCDEKGIRLITIFEDEWLNNQEICKSRILNMLGIGSNRIFARKCELKNISIKEANEFCKVNHLQGNGHTKIAYGLYFENELVSVMTFSNPSFAKKGKDYDWELNRFCSKLGVSVIGGLSKLLSQFKKDHPNTVLITFCDLRWGNGYSYEKVGFELIKQTRPNYYYFGKLTNWERRHRYSYTKHKLLDIHHNPDKNKTETQLADELDLYRIYDCGHLKFQMIL